MARSRQVETRPESKMRGKHADSGRHRKSNDSEYKSLLQILLEVVHVDLDGGEKHKIEDSYLSENPE